MLRLYLPVAPLVVACQLMIFPSKTSAALPIVDLGYAVHQATYNTTGQYFSFSNIRYAEAPTDALRFAAPIPPRGLNRTVNDGQDFVICPQTHPSWLSTAFDAIPGPPLDAAAQTALSEYYNLTALNKGRVSEDCLFLDVLVPERIFDSKAATNRNDTVQGNSSGAPVLVWIDGGGYSAGWKHEHNPSTLIGRSQLGSEEGFIYVAMNYRVGLFGFLAGPSFRSNGTANAGFYDQRLALDWVQENIHLFGGDPNRVTVMGESAGAGSIMHQITAYGGLTGPVPFQRAILQSPGFQPNPGNNFQEEIFKMVLTNASLLANTSVTSVQDLRKLPLSILTQVNDLVIEASNYGTYTFGPSVDGSFVPALPGQLLSQGQYDKTLSLMLGHNYHEGHLFTDPSITNQTSYISTLKRLFPSALPSTLSYIATQLYPAGLMGPNNSGNLTQNARAELTIGEAMFTCNTRWLSTAYGGKTYSYSFDVEPAIHAEDTAYTFYNGFGLAWDGRPVDVEVASALQDYIASFVMTGSPNAAAGGKNRPWFPMYGTNSSLTSINSTGLGSVTVDHLANDRCTWWQKALYF